MRSLQNNFLLLNAAILLFCLPNERSKTDPNKTLDENITLFSPNLAFV
jgi:hypothetical protein